MVGMGSWEIIEINVRDWRREKSIISSPPTIRPLGVDSGSGKKTRVRSRNRKPNKSIYVLRWYFWFIISAVVG